MRLEHGPAVDTCTAPAPSEDTRAPPGWAQEGLAPPVDHIGRPSSACHCDGLRAHSGTRAFNASSAGGDRNARSHAAEFSRSLLRTGMLIAWHAPCRRLTVGRLRLIRVRSSCQDWPRRRGEPLPRVSSRRVPLKEPLLRGRRPSCVSRIFILHILYFTELVGELLLRCHAPVGQRASRHVAQPAWSALPLSTGARSPEPAVMSCEHAFPGVSTWRLARKRGGHRSTASCVRGFG